MNEVRYEIDARTVERVWELGIEFFMDRTRSRRYIQHFEGDDLLLYHYKSVLHYICVQCSPVKKKRADRMAQPVLFMRQFS